MPTDVVIRTGTVDIPATLNDSVAAQDFRKRLPFKVSGRRSAVDYCCTTDSGRYDPAETQSGWKNGDISLAGGWFAILFDGEEKSGDYHGMMVIAHIEEEHLPLVKGLPDSVNFTVELAEKTVD